MTENRENMTPEILVLGDSLVERYGSGIYLDQDLYYIDAEDFWGYLLEYWKNRAGGKVTEFKDGTLYKTLVPKDAEIPFSEDPSPKTPQSDPHWGVPDHSHRTFPPPPDFNLESDDRADYEDYIACRLESICTDLWDLQALPYFSEKQRLKFAKIVDDLGYFVEKVNRKKDDKRGY